MSLNILAFGEVLWDIIEDTPCIGGAPLNFCGHCVRLGDKASIISSVGKDTLGADTVQVLRDLKVSDRFRMGCNSSG